MISLHPLALSPTLAHYCIEQASFSMLLIQQPKFFLLESLSCLSYIWACLCQIVRGSLQWPRPNFSIGMTQQCESIAPWMSIFGGGML